MKKVFCLGIVLFIVACNPMNKLTKQNEKKVVGVWKMLALRFHDGRVMAGEFMGNPYYEFSEEGKRTKTLRTRPAPPPKVVEYKIKGDSIHYPNTKYPSMKIKRLEQDTLVLANDKLSWFMARDK